MARRVLIRSRSLGTDVAKLEEMIAADYKQIYKAHIEALEDACDQIVADAGYLVPRLTGKLEDSISAVVSKSNRFPGLMVSASAKNHGYDYALIQEETEPYYNHGDMQYLHDYVREETNDVRDKDMGYAHYLGGPFTIAIKDLFKDLTGEELVLPLELEHAAEYVEDKL